MKLVDLIEEALQEAHIMECARDNYTEDNLLYVAQRLSCAPFFLVKEVYASKMKKELDMEPSEFV
jgi:hypothetical protein